MSYLITATGTSPARLVAAGDTLADLGIDGSVKGLFEVKYASPVPVDGEVNLVVRKVGDGFTTAVTYPERMIVTLVDDFEWVNDSTPYMVRMAVPA